MIGIDSTRQDSLLGRRKLGLSNFVVKAAHGDDSDESVAATYIRAKSTEEPVEAGKFRTKLFGLGILFLSRGIVC